MIKNIFSSEARLFDTDNFCQVKTYKGRQLARADPDDHKTQSPR